MRCLSFIEWAQANFDSIAALIHLWSKKGQRFSFKLLVANQMGIQKLIIPKSRTWVKGVFISLSLSQIKNNEKTPHPYFYSGFRFDKASFCPGLHVF
jgi:hypothetical protein